VGLVGKEGQRTLCGWVMSVAQDIVFSVRLTNALAWCVHTTHVGEWLDVKRKMYSK
jgi:hypothetical protein